MAFQEGNTLGSKGKPAQNKASFMKEVRKAIARDSGKRLKDAADELLNQAAAGEQWAITTLLSRLDGNVPTKTEHTGEDGGDITFGVKVVFEAGGERPSSDA